MSSAIRYCSTVLPFIPTQLFRASWCLDLTDKNLSPHEEEPTPRSVRNLRSWTQRRISAIWNLLGFSDYRRRSVDFFEAQRVKAETPRWKKDRHRPCDRSIFGPIAPIWRVGSASAVKGPSKPTSVAFRLAGNPYGGTGVHTIADPCSAYARLSSGPVLDGTVVPLLQEELICKSSSVSKSCSLPGLRQSSAIESRAEIYTARPSISHSRRNRVVTCTRGSERGSDFRLVAARSGGTVLLWQRFMARQYTCSPSMARIWCRGRWRRNCGTGVARLSTAHQEQEGAMGSDCHTVPFARRTTGRTNNHSIDAGLMIKYRILSTKPDELNRRIRQSSASSPLLPLDCFTSR